MADVQFSMISTISAKITKITPDVKNISQALHRIEGHVDVMNIYGDVENSTNRYNISIQIS